MISAPPRHRLARRLLGAHAIVVAAGAVTLAVVASLVGPPLFHVHVGRALGPLSDSVAQHLDQALTTALLLALAIGVTAALVTALVVSWILSSRIARPIEDLSGVAAELAAGDLSARAPRPRSDDELAELTDVFNDMAGTLEHTEETRRRLLSDLAHELRTPLSTIEGYLEGLADGVVRPERRTWEVLQEAAGRLHRLVDDVALVSRAEEGHLDLERRWVDVADVVRRSVAAAEDAFRRADVGLRSSVESGLPSVEVDPDRIQQVLANLLDNARRHTPPGGEVRVDAHRSSGRIVLEVADTGEGIDPAALDHLFERFFRGDGSRRSGGGSGIGLTIARAIVRAHGGDLTARSGGPGRGSTFTLELPTPA